MVAQNQTRQIARANEEVSDFFARQRVIKVNRQGQMVALDLLPEEMEPSSSEWGHLDLYNFNEVIRDKKLGVEMTLSLKDEYKEDYYDHDYVEICFKVGGTYNRSSERSNKIAITRWLLKTFSSLEKEFSHLKWACTPYSGDGHGEYRAKIYEKLGFSYVTNNLMMK